MSIKQLNKQNLQLALSQNKSYSGIQPYIQAIASGDLKALNQIINPVFVEILASEKAHLMSKLLVLRMYKDIFLIGNMEMFDEIDPAVQQAIISAAAYNPKFRSKGKNDKQTRGGMYFIQLQKRPKNTQSLQLGNSFVLFSTQIIKFFASWLPQYPDNEESRFLQAYEQLQALGVEFNTNIYLQEEQKNKFRKNYQQWRQRKFQTQKKQKNLGQQTKKSIDHKQNQIQKFSNSNRQEISSHQFQRELVKIEQSLKKKCQQVQNLKIIVENLKIQNQLNKKQNVQYSQKVYLLQEKLKQESQNKNNQIFQLSAQMEKLKNQINQLTKKKQKNHIIQKQLTNFKDQVDKLQSQKIKIFQSNKKMTELITKLQNQIDQLNNKNALMDQRLHILLQQNQRYKAKCDNQNQSEVMLQNKVQEEKKKNQILQKSLNQIKKYLDQKNRLVEELLLKIKQLQSKQHKNSRKISQKNINTSKRPFDFQNSENKQKQKPINYEQLCLGDKKQKNNQKQQSKIFNKKTISFVQDPNIKLNSNFFTNTVFNKRSFYQQPQKTKHSLHKTQSSKFRQQFSNSKQRKSTPLKQANFTIHNSHQYKEFQKFSQKVEIIQKVNSRQHKNIVTSIYPFIQQYFSPISMYDSKHFRASCISKQARQYPFYRDGFVQFRICQNQRPSNRKIFYLLIKNICSYPISIKLISQNQEIRMINQSPFLKIYSLEEAKVQVEAHVTNLNFRFPIFNISLLIQDSQNYFEKNIQQKSFKLPIPITLLSLAQITQKQRQLNQFDKFHENIYKKHRSQKISLNSQIKNLPSIFSELVFFKLKNQNIEARAMVSYLFIPGVKIKLNLIQNQQFCQFQTEFYINSKISQAFSKVILQALMFVCG